MTKKRDDKLLTDVESELMAILWRLGEGNVTDVLEQLPKSRDLAYTSVSTILRILEQKKVLKTRKEGRGHIYIPVLSKQEYETRTVRHVVDKVFDGAPTSLMRQLISSASLSTEDIQEMKRLLEKAEDK